ncbi:MAG: winged helix-turn-helix transcriptional regulator [Solirubrobacterales bacterium]
MTANTVTGSRTGERSGAQALTLLASPFNHLLLRALAEGPKQQAELQRETGSPAQTTLRAHLKRLAGLEVIDKHRRNRFPGVLEYELTPAGRNLLPVVDSLETWLGSAPEGPLPLGSGPAKAAIKALAEGWSAKMIRALAPGSLSLTELNGVIGSLSYPSLERRLTAMRLAGLIAPQATDGHGKPYAVTEWLRLGVAPLASAARWERHHHPRTTAPVGRLDIEAAFLLVMPLLRPPAYLSGACRMAAEIANGEDRRLAGVTVTVDEGTIASCTTQLATSASAWAHGSTHAWLDAMIERDYAQLELGGDCRLAESLLDGLHQTLLGNRGLLRP